MTATLRVQATIRQKGERMGYTTSEISGWIDYWNTFHMQHNVRKDDDWPAISEACISAL